MPAYAYTFLLLEACALGAVYASKEFHPPAALGHAIGWIGTASMVLMHVYSLRRRVRAFSRWGRIGRWLQLHIFLGLQGALLVTFHSLQLSTLGNLSGVTFALTLVVVLSGTFGRYLFSMLPRGLAGERLSARQIEAELAEVRAALDGSVGAAAPQGALAEALSHLGQPAVNAPAPLSLLALASEDRRARRAIRSLDRAVASGGAAGGVDKSVLVRLRSLARRRMVLQRRLATLASAERLFRGWTLFHRPLTFVLFGLVTLHVVGHYLYSAAFAP